MLWLIDNARTPTLATLELKSSMFEMHDSLVAQLIKPPILDSHSVVLVSADSDVGED
jgi:hypothetical protein